MSDEIKLPLKSIGWLSLLKIGAAAIGLLQTIAIAWLFGTSRAVEIFFAATTFQQLLLQLLSSGQIGDLFTPIYHEVKAQHGSAAARAAFAAMTNVMVLGSTIIAVLAAIFAGTISALLVPGFSAEDLAMTTKVFLVVAPLIVVLIVNSMYSNLLRAEHRYGIAEILQVISRVANLAVLLLLASSLGVWALIIGLWISAVIHFVGQGWCVYRSGPGHSWRLQTEHFHPRTVIFKLPLAFTHILSAQLFAFVLTATLSLLPEGNLAVFSYAQRLRAKFQGLVLQPVGIVFFNQISHSIAQGAAKIRSCAEQALGLTIAVVAACIVAIVAGGDLLLSGLWAGEKFPPERIQQAYWVLCTLTALLVLNAQYLIARRTNLALQAAGRQFAASGVVAFLCAGACYWVVPEFGLAGAVAMIAISALGNTVVSLIVLGMVRRDLVCLVPLGRFVQWTLATGLSVGFAWLLRELAPQADSLSRYAKFALGGFASAAGLLCLAAISLLLKIPEAHYLVDRFNKKFRRRSGVPANSQ